jgi:serine/threonine-protein kinase
VHKAPEIDKLPADVPPRLRRLIERCLQKDQSRRLQSIGDARIALQEWLENPEAAEVVAASGMAPAGWRRWLPWAVAAGATLAGLVLGATLLQREPPMPVQRSLVQVTEPPLQLSIGSAVAVSPDGRYLAYVTGSTARTALLIRPLDRFDTLEIAAGDNPDSPYLPFFSPDGEWIGFATPRELKKAPVSGGAPITLCELSRSRGASWGPDGLIVAALGPDQGLSLVPANGGEPQVLTTLDEAKGEGSHRWPQWLPGGRAILFNTLTTEGSSWNDGSIEVVEVDSGERRTLHSGGSHPRYVSTGHIVFYHEGTLFALPFDADDLEVTGSQFPVLEGVSGRPGNGSADFALSETGLLAYVTGTQGTTPYRIVWVDREGRAETLWEEPGLYGTPRLSPDGTRLALTVLRDANLDVWVLDLTRRVSTRLTFSDGYDADQVWSPDGRFIAFASDRDGTIKLYRKRADGSGQVEHLTDCGTEGQRCYPSSWSPDGRLIAATTEQGDVWLIPVDDEGEPEPYVASSALELDATFSPDGRWIAYQSSESGTAAVYVQSYPLGQGKWQVSDGVGWRPRWSPDGSELLYRTDRGMSIVSVDRGAETFQPTMARTLFTGSYLGDMQGVVLGGSVFGDYDIGPGGERFVMFTGTEGSEVAFVNLVSGWTGELRRLARSGRD